MIESDLISDILELSVEGEQFEEKLFHQIEFLTIKEEKYSGAGVFVYFNHLEGIEKYRIKSSNNSGSSEGQPISVINAVELINKPLNIQADTYVHFRDGLIEYVEIWNKIGSYPESELVTYELQPL